VNVELNGDLVGILITNQSPFNCVDNGMVIGSNGSVCVSLWIPLLHRYAESVGAKHYHTSAKLNKGIEELFLDLCKSKQPFSHVME
jgi:hypothetical protein